MPLALDFGVPCSALQSALLRGCSALFVGSLHVVLHGNTLCTDCHVPFSLGVAPCFDIARPGSERVDRMGSPPFIICYYFFFEGKRVLLFHCWVLIPRWMPFTRIDIPQCINDTRENVFPGKLPRSDSTQIFGLKSSRLSPVPGEDIQTQAVINHLQFITGLHDIWWIRCSVEDHHLLDFSRAGCEWPKLGDLWRAGDVFRISSGLLEFRLL